MKENLELAETVPDDLIGSLLLLPKAESAMVESRNPPPLLRQENRAEVSLIYTATWFASYPLNNWIESTKWLISN